jgi:glycogen debranching enzyme
VKAHGESDLARARALGFLDPLRAELNSGCLGQIAEIYDGDAPHAERGCCAQAWSVAEVLRALVEDVQALDVPAAKLRADCVAAR